jgi:hypothetical protein
LNIVEHRKERGESVRDGIRATVLHQSGQHFKTTAVILGTLVFEQETEGTVFNGAAKGTLPSPARLVIGWRRNEVAVDRAGGELRHPEIELNLFKRVDERLWILDWVNLEKLGTR